MGRATSPSTLKMLEILSDGAWHRNEELVVKAGALIQPGIAIRARERDRKRLVAARAAKGKKTNSGLQRSPEHQIAVGRRRLIMDALQVITGLEFKVDDEGTRWVRSTRPAPKEPHHR